MTLRQALQRASEILDSHHIESASLTAEVLLRHVLGISRVRLFQDSDTEITSEQYARFAILVERHIQGEPVAYLTGRKEFYGLDFHVDRSVLIPRPETEFLVEKALEIAGGKNKFTIADIGTGSGAIAITLAINLPGVVIYAVDISAQAIMTARENAVRHLVEARIRFIQGDLLQSLPEPVDLIIANLPYVRQADLAEPSIKYEPRTALDGGPDGLDVIRRFIPQISSKIKTGGTVLMEIGMGQSEPVVALLRMQYPQAKLDLFKDFNGIERVVRMKLH